jgi:hypothetical protein
MKNARKEWHDAVVKLRQAIGQNASIRAQIAKGEKWQGADTQSGHAVTVAKNAEVQARQTYESATKPVIAAAKNGVESAANELKNKLQVRCNKLLEIASGQIDLAEKRAYRDVLTAAIKSDKGDDPTYSAYLASHLQSTAEKLQAAEARLAGAKGELSDAEAQLPRLEALLKERVEALQALAV